jgi:hypothetical protein
MFLFVRFEIFMVVEERSASIIRVTRLGELGTTLAVTSNRHTQRFLQEAHGVTSQKTSFIMFPFTVPLPIDGSYILLLLVSLSPNGCARYSIIYYHII